ncbi:NAD(P)/FAD-dependent oxidoreductase [Dactylosporangium sucinum]|uniref:FAD-dependent oxidoreductase n=1 Tax=Dactylosporangium sucinum TaxID=1424081 RepID=A0A917T213_9ACTN|nr:NAD(P)/FAD-dependent oxidoreductase [Dactylosporangium sucinum]GGM07029.1 FAD-dependent oxidoreductase [Dactylosporangium sucinum]
MWDVVIVGARVAGAATALLQARRGARVLLVDRVRFPSDTLSTHQVQPAGIDMLERWGLLKAVGNAPGHERVRFDIDGIVIDGAFPQRGRLYSPRRTVLDAALVEAAAGAGAEVVQGYHVAGLLRADDGRVVGIRGRDGSEHRAGLVVGADGKHSLVAREVGARTVVEAPVRTVASYSYWEGVELGHGELYHRRGRAVAAFPTNDGLTMVYACAPLDEFDTWRRDPERSLLDSLGNCGDLGARVRAGRRIERVRTTNDLPNRVRQATGPGWALVGDARMVMDPVTAQGISNALRDAEQVVDRTAMFRTTQRIARLRPPGAILRPLLRAVAGSEARTTRFLGVFAGTVPPRITTAWLAGGRSRTPRAACPR